MPEYINWSKGLLALGFILVLLLMLYLHLAAKGKNESDPKWSDWYKKIKQYTRKNKQLMDGGSEGSSYRLITGSLILSFFVLGAMTLAREEYAHLVEIANHYNKDVRHKKNFHVIPDEKTLKDSTIQRIDDFPLLGRTLEDAKNVSFINQYINQPFILMVEKTVRYFGGETSFNNLYMWGAKEMAYITGKKVENPLCEAPKELTEYFKYHPHAQVQCYIYGWFVMANLFVLHLFVVKWNANIIYLFSGRILSLGEPTLYNRMLLIQHLKSVGFIFLVNLLLVNSLGINLGPIVGLLLLILFLIDLYTLPISSLAGVWHTEGLMYENIKEMNVIKQESWNHECTLSNHLYNYTILQPDITNSNFKKIHQYRLIWADFNEYSFSMKLKIWFWTVFYVLTNILILPVVALMVPLLVKIALIENFFNLLRSLWKILFNAASAVQLNALIRYFLIRLFIYTLVSAYAGGALMGIITNMSSLQVISSYMGHFLNFFR